MNCGLTNLDTLRRHLLAGSLGAETKFDTVLQAIGLGVAGMFDQFCNRKFAYAADDEVIIAGNNDHFILPRYPVVEVASVETRYADAESWGVATGEPLSTDLASGLMRFNAPLGDRFTQVKITYTGGYFFNTAEPDGETYPEPTPDGAIELPSDIVAAFLLQCENVWQNKDRAGASILKDDQQQAPKLAKLELIPLVEMILKSHIRYAIT